VESIIGFASLASLYFWFKWYLSTWPGKLTRFRPSLEPWLLELVPVGCAAVIWIVVTRFAASDVVNDRYYILFYFGMGILWLKVAEWLFRYLGIIAETDVTERSNRAALAAYSGALLGITLCYSGGNIGEGPGVEVVIFSSGLATIGFFLVWFVLTTATEIDYKVTVDRDFATGLRLGALLLAAGLILGRSVAGNWVSYAATWADFLAYGWPVLLLLGLGILVEHFARPTVERPTPPPLLYGILPAVVYIGGALIYLLAGYFLA
jgi:uncharacterized membrane protein YjfL (UPF0719 family)